jgi:1,4-alpha-glucan branching enzyme
MDNTFLQSYRLGGKDRYSAKRVLRPVNFIVHAPEAKNVCVIGDFNDWTPGAHPLTRLPDGGWHTQILLNHGHHQYLFLIDGKPTLDPKAQGIGRNIKNERVSVIAVS